MRISVRISVSRLRVQKVGALCWMEHFLSASQLRSYGTSGQWRAVDFFRSASPHLTVVVARHRSAVSNTTRDGAVLL